MKQVISILSIIATWIIMLTAGPVIWETPTDKIEGIILGLVITVFLGYIAFLNPVADRQEYDKFGDYIGKF